MLAPKSLHLISVEVELMTKQSVTWETVLLPSKTVVEVLSVSKLVPVMVMSVCKTGFTVVGLIEEIVGGLAKMLKVVEEEPLCPLRETSRVAAELTAALVQVSEVAVTALAVQTAEPILMVIPLVVAVATEAGNPVPVTVKTVPPLGLTSVGEMLVIVKGTTIAETLDPVVA